MASSLRFPALTLVVALVLLAPALLPHRQVAAGQDRDRFCPKGGEEPIEVSRLVDKRVGVARRMAKRHGCVLRVVKRNGEWLVITDDLRSDRVNVIVRERRVKRIHGVY